MVIQAFTRSQELAWDYIRSAVDKGVKASTALREYRAGGGSIRTQDWYRGYNSYQFGSDTWTEIHRFSMTETIPEHMWVSSPRNFTHRYVAEVKFRMRDLLSNQLSDQYRYIEADYRMSLSEIQRGLQDIMDELSRCSLFEPEGRPSQVEYIFGYKFYQRGEIT
ncbi:MAG: hypothetical protein AB1744_00880 [Candidatus Zixiibacteriota bacterium]